MKTAIQYRRDLRLLTRQVTLYLAHLDVVMAKPSTPERGSKIATLSNALQIANDIAIRYGLGKK